MTTKGASISHGELALMHAGLRVLEEVTPNGWPPHDTAIKNLRDLIDGRIAPEAYMAAVAAAERRW
jgi:hypothetical protein